ncbi:MAG: cellulase family glycosylhydrolase [Hyphomicrobiaceae bacterium]|nr:MAG: cellulase family glycosylhydrolase [Hyphomicrobiaceae bacterium]
MIGCNYTPGYAANQIEFWSAETFDPATIDRELGDAAALGFNAMRLYLHDLVHAADPQGLLDRIDRFLALAARHGLGVIPVIFDSVWHPFPHPGHQREPEPGVHNAGWVQSPGLATLGDAARFAALEGYVRSLIARFRDDARVLLWDVWNEPDNANAGSYGARDLGAAKADIVRPLLALTFAWARSEQPSQPLTTGVWAGHWDDASLTPLRRLQLDLSDIVSFHCYDDAAAMSVRIAELRRFGRPLLCTEYMARPRGSTFEAILPLLAREEIGAISWGLHRGRTQTHLAWDTWRAPCQGEPAAWFHDVLWPDGRPYRQAEADLIRRIAAAHAGPQRSAT